MRIAFDVSQAGPRKAGCGYYAAALLEALLNSQRHLRLTLLGSYGTFVHQPLQALQPPRPGCRWGPRLLLRSQAERFWGDRRRVERCLQGADVLHANNFWCPPWRPGPALVYTLYDLSFAEHPDWHRERNRMGCFQGMQRAAAWADWFVAISESSRQVFLRHFPHVDPERVRVIHPASRFTPSPSAPRPRPPRAARRWAGQPFLLSTGTIEPRKNQRFLLEVYGRYRESGGLPVPLVLAGGQGWLMDDFSEQLAASPWADDVHWLGYVSDGELAWLYSHCLLNLYPSHYEGFGLPVLEGMALGAPVLCSDTTSLPEIVADAGVLLNPADLDGWVRALMELLADPARLRALAEAGRARAALFDWRSSAAALVDLYDEAASAARRRR